MKKLEMLREVATRAEVTQGVAENVLDAFVSVTKEAMANQDEVNLKNFAKFYGVEKEAHEARNPMTGETVQVEAKVQPKCKFSTGLKAELNA